MSALQTLREQIDDCDRQLVELLAKRNYITAQVGAYKQQQGQPVYVPTRETELIAARRKEAEKAGVSPELIEDVLRRLMRESYQNQQLGLACTAPHLSPIVIVGGKGAMGQLFKKQLERSGYQVNVLDKDNQSERDNLLSEARCVIISVPIHAVESVISELPKLHSECLLVDITSVKSAPLSAMEEYHQGPILALHPMFGPDIPHWVKQTVVVCQNKPCEVASSLLEQLTVWGCNLVAMDAKKHDEAMQIVQVMRHLTTFVYGQFLAKQSHSLEEIESCSSPIYHLELMMVGRLFAQSPELYSDIMLAQFDDVSPLMKEYCEVFQQTFEKLKQNDKAGLIDDFAKAKTFFSDSASTFLSQSKALLSKANDAKVLDY
ncbi:bifunctional chorismate mutase/prephenate dehydrogenase [Pseudoalteromonas sp. G4]|uniref:bifunctional chorismate mutase/prephenate dehydrogenase n=1 Tax=Pseudoalteromonas sp. G4 TaxID=2992761 RepID=UPI00237DC7F0|nr:bifunctional chorismate mutase/prephenate dehydrogenase [Pseudoalteromonas sp. G4]MDE3273465.1 bifunctional chorismate mutase/prephenate dehydrogenase [Pseudoalteromonas sp. G4]